MSFGCRLWGVALASVVLLMGCSCGEDVSMTRAGGGVEIHGDAQTPVVVANGRHLGVAWSTRPEDPCAPIFDNPDRHLYFAVLDRDLNVVREPERLVEFETMPRYELLATRRGVGIVYQADSLGSSPVYVEYDLERKKLRRGGARWTGVEDGLLSRDGLLDNHISAFVHKNRVVIARRGDGAVELVTVARKAGQPSVLRVPVEEGVHPQVLHGAASGASLFAVWAGSSRSGGVVRYVFSNDGRKITKSGEVLTLSTEETYNVDVTTFAKGPGFQVFVHKGKEIWLQEYDRVGKPASEPTLLVEHAESIYDFTVATHDTGCHILYSESRSGWYYGRYYACEQRKVMASDDRFRTVFCDGGSSCVTSTQRFGKLTIQPLDVRTITKALDPGDAENGPPGL